MMFNIFKHKEENEPKTYEGRFITDEEISEMVKPDGDSYIKKEMKEIGKMFDELKDLMNNGGE